MQDAVRIYANELIDKLDTYRHLGDPVGTAVLNHISFLDVHHPDQRHALAAFNEVRETPIFAAFLSSELAGRMFDDGFGDWDEMGVPSLALSAFGQVMATQVQIEIGLRDAWV